MKTLKALTYTPAVLLVVVPVLVGLVIAVPTALAQTPPSAFWSFDDGGNPTMDDTGNGNNGTLFGTPVYDGDVPTQLGSGYSLDFNGTSHYIALDMSFTGLGTLPKMTASVWFKTTFAGGAFTNNWSFLDFDRSEFFNVFVTPQGNIGFSTAAANQGCCDDMFSTVDGLNDGSWHHVAVVYDGTNKSIYVDGSLDSTVAAHNGVPLGRLGYTRYGFIGDGSEATTFNGARNNILYEGKMDEVAFWNVALSATEITSIASGASLLTVTAEIDIKPGSDPNSVNLCSNGSVPVAVLGSDTFNVFDVVTRTLRFAEASVKVVGKKSNELCSYEDVNSDGYSDLVCKYVTTDIAAVDGESSVADVNGELINGTSFKGTDGINIVKDTCY